MSPTLSAGELPQVQALAKVLERRAQHVDKTEVLGVAMRLQALIAAWESKGQIGKYWDDYGNATSLLMSAEQYAATVQSGSRSARALWSTPNSMREVEPGTSFVLAERLQMRGGNEGNGAQ
jgi:hypothetical protein